MDLPGYGLARNPSGEFRFVDWLEDIDPAARLIKKQPDRPLFVPGSSQGSVAAFHSLAYSSAVDGAVTMGIILAEVPIKPDSASKRIGAQVTGLEAAAITEREGDRRRIDLRTVIDWDNDHAKEGSYVPGKKLANPLRTWSCGLPACTVTRTTCHRLRPPKTASRCW